MREHRPSFQLQAVERKSWPGRLTLCYRQDGGFNGFAKVAFAPSGDLFFETLGQRRRFLFLISFCRSLSVYSRKAFCNSPNRSYRSCLCCGCCGCCCCCFQTKRYAQIVAQLKAELKEYEGLEDLEKKIQRHKVSRYFGWLWWRCLRGGTSRGRFRSRAV